MKGNESQKHLDDWEVLWKYLKKIVFDNDIIMEHQKYMVLHFYFAERIECFSRYFSGNDHYNSLLYHRSWLKNRSFRNDGDSIPDAILLTCKILYFLF